MIEKTSKFEITIPKGYRRKPLPYFQEWVDALESGKFHQTSGTLCMSNGSKLSHCCLDVLSKVQGRLKRDKKCMDWYDQSPLFCKANKDNNDFLRSDCDLANDNPCFKSLGRSGRFPKGVKLITDDRETITNLISCNDYGHLSFKEIAQVIRCIWKA